MSELISLSKLFNQKILRIPDYQRGYAWKNQQLEDFWDDLNNLNGDRIHYTGMLSLKKLNATLCKLWVDEQWILDSGYDPYHVVDGQQRLTTFIILLNSIINLVDRIGENYINNIKIETIKEKYIVQVSRNKISKAYMFGYENDNPSFEYMRYIISGEDGSGTLTETIYTLNLQNAKDFFDKKINDLYEEKGYVAVQNIFSKLTNKLHFNIHYIEDDFDVFVAFETMNNRGKKLSNLEILKNRLIYLTTIYPDNVLNSFDKNSLRIEINKAWAEVYKQLGRNKNNPLDDDEYLKNHWTMYFKYSRISGDDYIQFLLNKQFTPKAINGENINFNINYDEEYLDDFTIDATDNKLYPIEINEYVKSLKEVAQFWYYSYNPDDSDFSNEEKLWLNRLNRLGIAYFRTLVVAAFMNKKVLVVERIKLLKVIERFIFIAFRMAKYNTSWLSNTSYTYARDLLKGNVSIQEITVFFEKNIEDNLNDMIHSFENDIKRQFNNYDGYYSWSGLKYMLFEYEAELAKGRNMLRISSWEYFTKTSKDKISIEHIYPQKPTRYYWRNQFRKYQSEKEKHSLANSLGNLLPLSMSVNSSLQNDDFISKKQNRYGYDKGSYSEGEIAVLPDWNPSTILDRGLKLLEFIEKRWKLSFGSKENKISLLGLSFLLEEREDIPEIKDVDFSDRDDYYNGDKGELKVSEYLKNKDLNLVEYYFRLFNSLKNKIPSLYEVAKSGYIALRCSESKFNLAEIHIQNAKGILCINTKEPKEKYDIGEKVPQTHLWTLNYRIYLKENADFEETSNIIFETYKNRLELKLSDDEMEAKNKEQQVLRTSNVLSFLRKYEEKGIIKIVYSSNTYVRFVTPTIRKSVGLCGDGTWDKIEDLIVYEIDNRKNKASLSLYIGPGKKEIRDKWTSFALKNSMFKVSVKKNWTPIYRITLFLNDDSNILKNIAQFLENDLNLIDEIFKK